jgi:hypothetical protein
MASLDGKGKKKRSPRMAGNGSGRFVRVTCAPAPGAVEVGLLLTFCVVGLYLYGFYEVVGALPNIPSPPNWRSHLGENLNLARNEWNDAQRAASPIDTPLDPTIPLARWPVSLRDEPNNVETLLHTGDGTTQMSVPRFWSKPIHQDTLMTRATAMRVGSCIQPDAHGNHARGESCPTAQRTIFVAIASYRDFECRSTVESIFTRAAHPERIRVAVVDQIVHGEDVRCDAPIQPCDTHPEQALCQYKNQLDVYEMAAELSVGPVFARHIGHRMYRGEYYATQSDAHVTYTQNWDADIITQLEATGNELAVLTTYLTDVQGSIDKNGKSLRNTRPIMCNTAYEGGAQGMHLRHGSQPEKRPSIHGMPQLQPWWAAGYSFSRGHFVVNVPYDPYQPMIFQGEEMSIGIRGFTIGYDYYAPERSVCFHHYAVGDNAKIRNKVHHFWENDNKYAGTGKKAMKRLLGIVHMNPEVDPKTWNHAELDMYGVGLVRTPEKFYELFGIDVVQQTTEKHLCRFVDGDTGKMHKLFHDQHLRRDGMGIDYADIDYKFVDPNPNE